MAAAARFQSCSRFLVYQSCSWSDLAPRMLQCRPVVVSGMRNYRGSNRDTRRRQRNLEAKQRKREGKKPKVFDKKEFMKQNYDKELFAFKHRLSLSFDNERYLKTALTQASDDSTEVEQKEHNSKLALLGYNLTSQYITEYLCFKFPKFPQEGIKCLHDFLTSRDTLVKVAELTALPELIKTEYDLDLLSQERHLNMTREDVISDSFLALIGAIYLDQGSQEANSFIQDFLISQLYGQEFKNILQFDNPEILLESILLQEGREKPEARITRQSGKSTHLPVYVVGIFSGESSIGEAAGYNLVSAKVEKNKERIFMGMPRDLKWDNITPKATNTALMNLIQRGMSLEPSLPSSKENYRPARNT